MNPLKFLNLFNKKIQTDILNYSEIDALINSSIFVTTVNNDFISTLIDINFFCKEIISESLDKTSTILSFIKEYVKVQNIFPESKEHVNEYCLIYFLICFSSFGSKHRLRGLIEQFYQYSKNTSYTNYEENNHEIVLISLNDVLASFQEELLSSLLPDKNDVFDFESKGIYKDIIFTLHHCWERIVFLFNQNIVYSLSQMGCTPSYWSSKLKLKLRLLSDCCNNQVLKSKIHIIHKKLPGLFPAQHFGDIEKSSFTNICYYFNYLPMLDNNTIETFPEIKNFLHVLYSKPQLSKQFSTLELKPKDVNILVQQYLTLFMKNWKCIWIEMKWKINMDLLRNIQLYRQKYIIPDIKFLTFLFFKT